MIQIVLVGALGRMGNAIETAASSADDVTVKARIDRVVPAGAASPGPGTGAAGYSTQSPVIPIERLGEVLAQGDVVIEFSSPEGCARAAAACAKSGAGLVTGTTGLGVDEESFLAAAAARVPVLRSANFSLGVLALRRALAAALEAVPGWDVEIIERHHRRKIDAPSGTALQIARDVTARRGVGEDALRFGRQGRTGPRPEGEIGMHSLRAGTWVGDHQVLLAGEGEWLEVRHVAEDRAAFAHGAIAAARFVAHAGPGLYTLEDVLTPPQTAS